MTLTAEPKSHPNQDESGPGSASLAHAKNAILAAYPNIEGQMIVRKVSSGSDTSWYRVNWYKQGGCGMYIHHSRFLALRKTAAGVVVEDQTVRPRQTEASMN